MRNRDHCTETTNWSSLVKIYLLIMLVDLRGPCTRCHWHFLHSPGKVQHFLNLPLLCVCNLHILLWRDSCLFYILTRRIPFYLLHNTLPSVHVHVLQGELWYLCKVVMTILIIGSASNLSSSKWINFFCYLFICES